MLAYRKLAKLFQTEGKNAFFFLLWFSFNCEFDVVKVKKVYGNLLSECLLHTAHSMLLKGFFFFSNIIFSVVLKAISLMRFCFPFRKKSSKSGDNAKRNIHRFGVVMQYKENYEIDCD